MPYFVAPPRADDEGEDGDVDEEGGALEESEFGLEAESDSPDDEDELPQKAEASRKRKAREVFADEDNDEGEEAAVSGPSGTWGDI